MIGRKAQIEDFGEFLLAGVVIAILVFVAFFFISQDMRIQRDDFEKEKVILESSYLTRIMLQHEIEPGYKVYQKILDISNSGSRRMEDYSPLYEELDKIFQKYYASADGVHWVLMIDGFHVITSREDPMYARDAMPSLEIPNPEGENVEVLIFEVKDIHHKFDREDVIQRPGDDEFLEWWDREFGWDDEDE